VTAFCILGACERLTAGQAPFEGACCAICMRHACAIKADQDRPESALMPDVAEPGILMNAAGYAVAGKVILSGISVHLTQPRIGIIGRNGSGKSTLLRLMAGLIAPTSGSVLVAGRNPFTDRRAVQRQIGILFQNPDHQILFPTVAEELAFGLRQLGQSAPVAEAAAHAALATEGRSHWAAAATHTLSQGQRHYLCLLAVLLMGPQIILLDEPFAGLDLPTQSRLERKLASLSQQIITISHDPAAVAGCDRVIWLDDGQIMADGPAHAVLAAFTAAMQRLGDSDADTDIAR